LAAAAGGGANDSLALLDGDGGPPNGEKADVGGEEEEEEVGVVVEDNLRLPTATSPRRPLGSFRASANLVLGAARLGLSFFFFFWTFAPAAPRAAPCQSGSTTAGRGYLLPWPAEAAVLLVLLVEEEARACGLSLPPVAAAVAAGVSLPPAAGLPEVGAIPCWSVGRKTTVPP
jgi:hypothetical protein